MPCRCDYFEETPSVFDKQVKNTIKNLLWVKDQMGVHPGEELVNAYTKNTGFTLDEGDKWVAELCATIELFSDDMMERIVYNAKSKKSRRLADWWEEHQAADRKRRKKEKKEHQENIERQMALSKLTKREKKLLGLS